MKNSCTNPSCLANPDMFECHDDCSKCPYWTAYTCKKTPYWAEQS